MSESQIEETHLELETPSEPVDVPRPLGRGQRTKQPTWKILESLPQPVAPFNAPPSAQSSVELDSVSSLPTTHIISKQTSANVFGLYREYFLTASVEPPDDSCSLSDMSYHSDHAALTESHLTVVPESVQSPFSSETVFHLMNWMWTGSQLKSKMELNKLVHEVLLAPGFDINDL